MCIFLFENIKQFSLENYNISYKRLNLIYWLELVPLEFAQHFFFLVKFCHLLD